MTYGVEFNGENTLERYGLMLLADVSIGKPALKSSFVDIPGADGSLNFSYFTGRPVYEDLPITFTLFSAVPDHDLYAIRDSLMAAYHGQIVEIVLPMYPLTFYRGVVQFGEVTGYNRGRIPVEVRAEPWRYFRNETVVSRTGSGTVSLSNQRMPVTPWVTATAAAALTWSGHSVSLSAGADQLIPALTLDAGTTVVEIETTGTVTFTYREGTF